MPIDPTARKTVTEKALEAGCTGLLLAVSGGADSMAMLGWYAGRTLPFPLTVAHVHHGLRPESEEEARLVEHFCSARGIPCHILRTDVRREMKKGETVESAARRLRYAFFRKTARDCGASHLATAHTADDQAETVLLHLLHGAGLKGLCGILPLRREEELILIRPLLECSRADTESFCTEKNIPYATDKTNTDLSYTRNRIRHRVLPELLTVNPKAISALGRTAATLQVYQRELEDRAEAFLHRSGDILSVDSLRALPEGERTEVLRLFCAGRGKDLSAEQTAQGLRLLTKAEGTVEFDRRWVLHSGQDRLTLTEKTHKEPSQEIHITEEETLLPDGRILRLTPTIAGTKHRHGILPRTLPLVLRTRNRGDRIATCGGTKSLAKVMMEQKIPAEERDRLRILAGDEGILWCEKLNLTLKTAPKAGEEAYFVSLSEE